MICGVIRPRLRQLCCGVLVGRPLPAVSRARRPGCHRRSSRSRRHIRHRRRGRIVGQRIANGSRHPTGCPGATVVGSRAPVVDHGPRTGARVALTFDADMTDGMLASLRAGRVKSYANLRILDLLEREQVPATFFLTGKWVQRYPDVTRRIAGNPRFEVANHTYGHAAFTADCYDLPRLPVDELAGDVARTFEVIAPYGVGRPATSGSRVVPRRGGAGRVGAAGCDGGRRGRGQRRSVRDGVEAGGAGGGGPCSPRVGGDHACDRGERGDDRRGVAAHPGRVA
ncbi:polysaccharide deacetylase family protein [Micromonospora sp. M12]